MLGDGISFTRPLKDLRKSAHYLGINEPGLHALAHFSAMQCFLSLADVIERLRC